MGRIGLLLFSLLTVSILLTIKDVSGKPTAGCMFFNTDFTIASSDLPATISADIDELYKVMSKGENITCYWRIKAPPGHFVKLRFTQFLYFESFECDYYYVEVREGRNGSGLLLKRKCANSRRLEMPDPVFSLGRDLFVKVYYKYTPLNMKANFSAELTAVPQVSNCSLNNSVDSNNNIVYKGSQGQIATPYSHRYQGYPPNFQCTWRIVAPPGYIVKVEFSSFVLWKYSADCELDYVKFYDGPPNSGTSLGQYCGTWARTTYSISSGLTVHFASNRLLSSKSAEPRNGFVATYQILKSDSTGQCTDTSPSNHMSGQGGTLFSPNYPASYPSNRNCTWVITPPKGHHLRFATFGFSLQASGDPCDYTDHLEIRRGTTANGSLIGSFCGSNGPMVLYSKDSLWLQFVSKQNSDTGFLTSFSASYESIEKIPRFCSPLNNATVNDNLQLSGHRGVFRSPYYPANYPNSFQCTWKIVAPPGKRIKFTINDLDLGSPYSDCPNDYLLIRNGLSESSPMLGKYCMANWNKVIYSDSNSLWIRFHSDSKRTSKGFDAGYQINELCDKLNDNLANGNIRLSGSSGNFTSPGYPANYPKLMSCIWKITVPEGKRVKLTFSAFNVSLYKPTSTCSSGDFVKVSDGIGEHTSLIKTLCGTDIPDPIYSSSNKMEVFFRSRSYGTSSGFKVQFSAAYKINIAAVVGGVAGAVVVIIVIAFTVFYILRKRRRNSAVPTHVRMY